jgi:hypothetical protein
VLKHGRSGPADVSENERSDELMQVKDRSALVDKFDSDRLARGASIEWGNSACASIATI